MLKQHLFIYIFFKYQFCFRILTHFRPHCRVGTLSYACQDNRVLQISDGTGKKKVVILGTGWAGASFLRNIDTSLYDVHVVSPRNYFMFTPLLPSVTCGTVEPRSIVEPIRNIVRKVPFF